MGQIGKIGRLPREIREQLNQRLRDGEPGPQLLQWLNSLDATQKLLAAEFSGREISDENLSQWKDWGYRHWLERQESLAHAAEMMNSARELTASAGGALSDHLATLIAAKYARMVWEFEAGEDDEKTMDRLRSLCLDIARLRRGDHSRRRINVLEGHNRGIPQGEVLDYFFRWAQQPRIKQWICDGESRPAAKLVSLRRLFGLGDRSNNEGPTSRNGQPPAESTNGNQS